MTDIHTDRACNKLLDFQGGDNSSIEVQAPSPLQMLAFERAIQALANLGAKYVVQAFGETFSNMPAEEGKKCVRNRKRFEQYNIKARLMQTEDGVLARFDLIEGTDVTIEQLQSNVCAHASDLFGSGNYKTKISGNGVDFIKLVGGF